MSRNYKFHHPEGLYFVSFAVVNWIDVFTRNEYLYSSAIDYAGEQGLLKDVEVSEQVNVRF